ncbi:MAG: ABC transporter substrate-binding protein, partial [Actinomycetota bacterium]|nr:ABC transporter substrate-binding protein [Actinomycetota bacterium]
SVRQAIAYSLDREAMVTQLSAPLLPGAQPIQSLLTPGYGKFYTEPFARYRPDLNMVAQLMTGDGWTKGTDGLWTKGTEKATIAVKYAADNQRRQLGAQIIQTQLKAAGFLATPTPEAPGALFGQDLASGGFVAVLSAQDRRIESPTLPQGGQPIDSDPRLCQLFCSTTSPTSAVTTPSSTPTTSSSAPTAPSSTPTTSSSTPTASSSTPTTSTTSSSTNFVRIDDPNVNRSFTDLDTNLGTDARIADATHGMDILADLVPAIPIGAVPDILVVNKPKLGVEGGVFQHNLAYGPYAYLNEWYLN